MTNLLPTNIDSMQIHRLAAIYHSFFQTKSPLFFAGSDAAAAQPLGLFAVGRAGSWQVWAVTDPAGGEVPPSAELCRGGHARVCLHTSAGCAGGRPRACVSSH